MVPSDTIRVSALLLAGGQGSRLGGRDKGLMPWQGRPVAAHLAAQSRKVAHELLISCNRNQAVYQQWADQLVGDDEPGFPGPLMGILAGLQACAGSHLLVLPCDLPWLDSALLELLRDQAQSQPGRPCLVRAGEQWQPLLTVIPKALLPALQTAWIEGQRSPLRWLLNQSHSVVQVPSGDSRLHNANTLADWSINC